MDRTAELLQRPWFIASKELSFNTSYCHGTDSHWLTLEWERNFDYEKTVPWLIQNYGPWTWFFAVTYVVSVFSGLKFMEKRPAYDMKIWLQLWNLFLAVFSIIGAYRTLPEIWEVVTKDSYYDSVCVSSFLFKNNVTALWTLLFSVSKVAELLDTFFLVVRKRPVIFLHWYHHTTVIFFGYYCWINGVAPARYYAAVNFGVHSIMYSYYFLRSCRVRVPLSISMAITSLQILQMVVGTCWTVSALAYKYAYGRPCAIEMNEALWFIALFLSFLILFGKFFRDVYVAKKPKKRSD